MRFGSIAVLLAVAGCAKPSREPRSTPPAIVDTRTNAPASTIETEPSPPEIETAVVLPPLAQGTDEVTLGHRRARLPDGIVFEPEGDHFAFHLKTSTDEASMYSYIEPGDVELVHDRWLFVRDTKTTARARRWVPRVAKMNGTRGDASIHVGDRIEVGKWTIEWIGIMPGSSNMTGVRIAALRGFHAGLPAGYWQSDGKVGAHHDFAGDEGLAQLEVTIASANMAKAGLSSTLSLRLREVDRATRATFGTPLSPGLFALPNKLRVRFEKSTMCATSSTNCVCSDVFDVKAEEVGKSESFGIPNDGSTVQKLGHGFRLVNGQLVVTK